MSPRPSVSVCLPAYNEAATVYEVGVDAHRVVSALTPDFELLICDDGSTDDTATELERLRRELAGVVVLRNHPNRGLAFTFTRLYQEARKDYVFLNATDGQWPNALLAEMYAQLGEFDIVASVRRQKFYPLPRDVISFIYNLLPVVLFGVVTRDAGGVKLIARRYLYTDSLVSRSPFADAERLIRGKRDGARVRFIPVDTRPRRAGKSNSVKPRVLWDCVVDVARLFWFVHFTHAGKRPSIPGAR